jgi:hypothetical protein
MPIEIGLMTYSLKIRYIPKKMIIFLKNQLYSLKNDYITLKLNLFLNGLFKHNSEIDFNRKARINLMSMRASV